MRDFVRPTAVIGLTFIVLGTLFLLEQLGYLSVSIAQIWAAALIGLGLAVITSGTRRRRVDDVD